MSNSLTWIPAFAGMTIKGGHEPLHIISISQGPGSPLFKKIWTFCQKIPKGKVATYRYLARCAGKPRGARVAAQAMARNPYAPSVPCHRVIRADGSLGGYSAPGGLARKRALLAAEGVRFNARGRVLPAFILD